METYDLVIFGGGSAGIVSGVMAGGLGMRVLLVEKYRMGGECLNTGCVPSKALIHAANTAHRMRNAGRIGLTPIAVDGASVHGVLPWVRKTIDDVRIADASEQLLKDQGVTLRMGDPHFIDPHIISIGPDRMRARQALIATGSRPKVPDIPGLREAGYLTNQNLFDLNEIPESLLVVGGGPIGVEMAQAFQRLGSKVTLIQKGKRLLPRDDAELAGALLARLRSEGIDVLLETTLGKVEIAGSHPGSPEVRKQERAGSKMCSLHGPAGTSSIPVSDILIAAGRAPNIGSLSLDAAAVRFTERGIEVDATMRTSAPHIYACGDVTGRYQFSHIAEYEAKIAVRNMAFPGSSRADYAKAPWATFTDPEVVHIGITEEEAKAQGLRYEVFRQPFAQNDRAITDDCADGFVKVIATGPLGKIAGVHILGPRGSELAHEWILAMERGGTIRDIADLVHIYPTLSMANQHAAQRWYQAKSNLPGVRAAMTAWSRVLRPHSRELASAAAIGLGAAFLNTLSKRRG